MRAHHLLVTALLLAPGVAWGQVTGVPVPLPTLDGNGAAFSAWPPIAPTSGTYAVPAGTRVLSANVTSAGNISLTDASGNVKTYGLAVGYQTIPYLPATFTTTATATFWADK